MKKLFLILTFVSLLAVSNAVVAQEYKNLKVEDASKKAMELVKQANQDNSNGNYLDASEKLEAAYHLVPKDTLYLFHAAQSAVKGEDYKRALIFYTQLKNMGFNGVFIDYKAVSKKTGKMEMMSKKMRDSLLKVGLYRDPVTQKSESKKPVILNHIAQIYQYFEDYEKALSNYLILLNNGFSTLEQEARATVYTNIAIIYINQDKRQKALDFMKWVRINSPNDINLEFIKNEANLYYLVENNIEVYKALLAEAAVLDPTNTDYYYNIGVINMEQGNIEEARANYRKALAINPGYHNARLNLSTSFVNEGNELVDEMNLLGNTQTDTARYDELKLRKDGLFRKAAKILEEALKYGLESKELLPQLKNIYGALGDTDNFDRINKLLLDK